MKANLQTHILERLGKTPKGLEQVLQAFHPLQTTRKQVLLEVQEICKHCYFVVQGCVQVAATDRHGNESTTNLVFEGEWVTAIHSFVNQQPSNERLVCVEPSNLLAITSDQFQRLSQQFPEFEQIYRAILEESYTQSMERIRSLMGMSALERVRWLLSQHPLIFTRLSNRLIASYLNLSEATLSRLKAKL